MSYTREVSISDFANAVSGKIYVPANINGEMSEWVQVVKADLLKVYRAYGIRWIEIDDTPLTGKVYVHEAN